MIRAGSVLLETCRPDSENRDSLYFADPHVVVEAFSVEEVLPTLREVDAWLARGFYVAGYLDYEAGFAFESIAELPRQKTPIVWFGVYERPSDAPADLMRGSPPDVTTEPRFSLSRTDYRKAIRQVKDHLFEGDVYQINLTGSFAFEYDGSASQLYQTLRNRQPVAYNALICNRHVSIVSCSPELFFRRSGDRITTRPMKGTVRRGRNSDEDAVLTEWLRSDEKTRAENLMIVDLLRNDLSRIARFGSVETTSMFQPELYPSVIQLTSTVEAKLPGGIGYTDIFSALFPCGSVTGAPKVRAMKIINRLEDRPRGVYTGAIGYASPDGDSRSFRWPSEP